MESLWRDPHRPACDSTTPHIRSAATQLTVYRVPRDESRESRGGESRERPPISPRRWREHDTHIGSHHMTSKYEERWKNDLQRNHRAAVATCDVTMLVKVCPAVRQALADCGSGEWDSGHAVRRAVLVEVHRTRLVRPRRGAVRGRYVSTPQFRHSAGDRPRHPPRGRTPRINGPDRTAPATRTGDPADPRRPGVAVGALGPRAPAAARRPGGRGVRVRAGRPPSDKMYLMDVFHDMMRGSKNRCT